MKKTKLQMYAELRAEIKGLETRESDLKMEIVKEMEAESLDKVESDYGNFTIGRRKTWSYSDKVAQIEEKLRIQRFTEQEKGIAKSSETPYLIFKAVKENE